MIINIYGESLEKSINKKVLLFSGGLDSWITACLWHPDVLLYCAIGHKYQEKELKVIHSLLPYLPENQDGTQPEFINTHRIFLRQDERKDAIIPLRNLYFVMVASRYGDRIGLGVLHGEVNGDKSYAFARMTETLFDICYNQSYWSEGRQIKIEYPICHYTKAEAIQKYLDEGYSKETLLQTTSCYEGKEKPCGLCSNCLKRYIAFQLNEIEEEFENDPRTSPFVQEFINRISTYDKKRREEIRRVLIDG